MKREIILEKLEDILEGIVLILFFPIFIIFTYPKLLWENRKICPYWDYPYCKKNSLMPDSKPCRLGDAKMQCLHYPKNSLKNKRWIKEVKKDGLE